MPARKRTTAAALAALVTLAAACGGGERQDAAEPGGDYRVEVTEASFPERQAIAEGETLAIEVRNADSEAIPNVAVTVETSPEGEEVSAPLAFGQKAQGGRLADSGRPVWIVDQAPSSGTTAYTNTWALGRLAPGDTRRFEWEVTPVQAGDYTLSYRVAPGLHGNARPASGGRARGTFEVSIAETPREARVTDEGETVVAE